MINNFSSQKIQNDLFILTGYKYSISYVDKNIKRIFKEIILSKKKKFIISGSQNPQNVPPAARLGIVVFYKKLITRFAIRNS